MGRRIKFSPFFFSRLVVPDSTGFLFHGLYLVLLFTVFCHPCDARFFPPDLCGVRSTHFQYCIDRLTIEGLIQDSPFPHKATYIHCI